LRVIYDCPICGVNFDRVEGAGLFRTTKDPIVCPNGHKITKLLRKQRRRHRVQDKALRAGLSEDEYRKDRRKQAAWDLSSLNPWRSR
jgi:hypothetical protein